LVAASDRLPLLLNLNVEVSRDDGTFKVFNVAMSAFDVEAVLAETLARAREFPLPMVWLVLKLNQDEVCTMTET
jgi:hypothetical protein